MLSRVSSSFSLLFVTFVSATLTALAINAASRGSTTPAQAESEKRNPCYSESLPLNDFGLPSCLVPTRANGTGGGDRFGDELLAAACICSSWPITAC